MGTVCAGGLGSKRARAPGRYLRYLRKVGYLTARRGTIVPIAVREVAVAAACVRTCPTKPTGAAVQLEIVPRPLPDSKTWRGATPGPQGPVGMPPDNGCWE